MEHKIEYVENDLVRIAKRENNMRRKYLVVNPLQGKHVPVVPSKALKLFTDLADVFRNEYKNEKLFLHIIETSFSLKYEYFVNKIRMKYIFKNLSYKKSVFHYIIYSRYSLLY